VKSSWTDHAWDEYLSWQTQDRKMLKRINALIADTSETQTGKESAATSAKQEAESR